VAPPQADDVKTNVKNKLTFRSAGHGRYAVCTVTYR